MNDGVPGVHQTAYIWKLDGGYWEGQICQQNGGIDRRMHIVKGRKENSIIVTRIRIQTCLVIRA